MDAKTPIESAEALSEIADEYNTLFADKKALEQQLETLNEKCYAMFDNMLWNLRQYLMRGWAFDCQRCNKRIGVQNVPDSYNIRIFCGCQDQQVDRVELNEIVEALVVNLEKTEDSDDGDT